MPPQRWDLNGPPSRSGSRGPPSSRASSRSVTPRNRDASPFKTTNSNLGKWERVETPSDKAALMSPQMSNRPPSVDSRRGSSQSVRGNSGTKERSSAWERMSLVSARSDRSLNSAEKTRAKRADTPDTRKRADTPQPRKDAVPPQKKSAYRWTGQHDEASGNCKCPVCAPMNIASSRVAGLYSGAINLTLSDKLNLTEKPELGAEAPDKPELKSGFRRRGTQVGELIENRAKKTSKTATKTDESTGGMNSLYCPRARKTEVGAHLVLAGNEPRPEDSEKFDFHTQFPAITRKKKGYFSRPSHTGLSMQGPMWKERVHLKGVDTRCPAEKELGWNPEPQGTPRESFLAKILPNVVPDGADGTFTPQSMRSRSSSIRSARGPLQKSLSEKDLPRSGRMSDTSSARGERRRRSQDAPIVSQVPDRIIGAKFEDIPQEHLYHDHRGDTNEHFHMAKPNPEMRPSLFQSGVGLVEQDARTAARAKRREVLDESDLVCDSYHFEEGMPWLFSQSKGFGHDLNAKRRLKKWGEFSHGPSLRYVVLEERAKPLYRYHRAVSAPPEVSGERHAASLLGSMPILGGDRGRCKDSWESWRPAKRGCDNQQNKSSHEVADAVRNAEINDYGKNFKKRLGKDPKFAQLCKETAEMHRQDIETKKQLRQRWQTTSIGALLQPECHP